MNAPATEAQLRHELGAIRNYLVAAQDVVRAGHMPTLGGLEDRIARLCESIQQATPGIQKICLPELFTLIEHLNACEKAMRETHKSKTTGDKKP